MPTALRLLGTALLVATVTCSNPNALALASISNVEDTITISALTGTPLQAPSAYSIGANQAVRTDQTSSFDFLYDVQEPSKQSVFVPLAMLGLVPSGSLKPGILPAALPFDAIASAALNGYITDDTVHVSVGDRFVVRSRAICSTLGVPIYGKIVIDAIDSAARTITFRTLINNNCGYRGLLPGIPTN